MVRGKCKTCVPKPDVSSASLGRQLIRVTVNGFPTVDEVPLSSGITIVIDAMPRLLEFRTQVNPQVEALGIGS